MIYNANRRAITAGDTYPARYLPFAIWQHHTLLLDPIEKITAQGRGNGAFWMVRMPGGHIISLYPVVVPLVVAPLYAPAIAWLHVRGWTDARLDWVARVMEKLSASFVAALSAALLYLLLRHRATRNVALLLTAAYAFGTTTWVISSQALWQHGVAELLIIGALLFITAPVTTRRVVMAGLLCGMIAANRPPDVVLGAALGVYALFWARSWRRILLLAAASAVPMLLVLAYNLRFGGNILGGYGVIGKAAFFSHDLAGGIAGLLFSPTHGLFVFSPFLLFLALAWRHRAADRGERQLALAITIGVVLQLALYAKADWRAGLSWGPRYMTDALPLLMWMLAPVVTALRGVGRASFFAATGLAIAFEAIGAFTYSPMFDIPIFAADRWPVQHDMRGAWNWRNAPFLTSPKHGFAPAELFIEPRGSFDGIETPGGTSWVVDAGQEAYAAGWALAGHATPAQLMVMAEDGSAFGTSTFVDRPDVRATLGESSPAGWRAAIDTKSLAPGQHRLTAFVWITPDGEGHYLEERTLTVRPAAHTLEESARNAAARIREHQQAAGFWLTQFTSETRFHDPHPEMNTFLTALLIDMLDTVAATNGLEESVQRARRHLTDQIEANGLVRYHGLPDGPGIGTLGCVITPDTDDTALAWRIAPPRDRNRLADALAIIDRYRTRDGLYRSWLAPREEYQCLDPGSDPNPTDIAIQMHLLLLLSEVRPAAGHALCEALRPLVDDDRIWVYYRKAPLVPMLRLRDLRRAGCELQLPDSRTRATVPGQELWLSVARLLQSESPDATRIEETLHDIARNDFELVRTNPPLFYHNDMTATVPRFYWSQDFGYALWLRLYDEYQLHPSNPAR